MFDRLRLPVVLLLVDCVLRDSGLSRVNHDSQHNGRCVIEPFCCRVFREYERQKKISLKMALKGSWIDVC